MRSEVANSFKDIVVAQFPNEADTCLFAPTSGEVFLCATEDWERLKADPNGTSSSLKDVLSQSGLVGL